MAKHWRWTGEVIQGDLTSCRVEVRSHGFPEEMYLLAVGRELASTSTFVTSMRGLNALSQALSGLGLTVLWDHGVSPFDEEVRPARGRRGRGTVVASQSLRLPPLATETLSGVLRRVSRKTF